MKSFLRVLFAATSKAGYALTCLAAVWFGSTGLARADYQSAVTGQSPVGYWRLNDAVAAPPAVVATNLGTLGAVAHGTLENDVLVGVAGALPAQASTNTAIRGMGYLNGNRVRVPFHPVLNTNGSFSVEFWCKPGQTNDAVCPAASTEFADPSTNQVVRRGWLFYQGDLSANGGVGNGHGWLFRIYYPPSGNTPQQMNCAVAQTVETNRWYHIVGVYKATNPGKGMTLYVNGASAATASVAKNYEPVVTNTIPLTFGARADGDFGFFTYLGDVDEGAFYPYALGPAEVLANYQAGTNLAPATPYQNVVLGRNPAGYWRMNEKPGPAAANLGSSGSAAEYLYAATPGLPGPRSPTFTGFDAANKAVEILTNNPGCVRTAPLAIDTNTVTMAAWIKPNGAQNPYSGIFVNAATDGTYAGLTMGLDGGFQLGYIWNNDAATYDFPSTVTVPDGQWSFVALSVGPDQAVLYAHDGTTFQTNVNTLPHPVQGFNGWSRIGMDYIYAPFTVFNGLIDEVAIFKRTLSVGEVYTLYAAGKGGVGPTLFQDVIAPPVLSVGETLALSVDAGGTPTLTYQWRKNSQPITGATNNSYVKGNLSFGDDGYYDVVVSNAYGTVTSSLAAVSVQSQTPPLITQEPVGTTVYVNGSIQVAVTALGGGLQYQWYKGSTMVEGGTNAILSYSPAMATNAGNYSVIVNNSFGAVTSLVATVTVIVPAVGSYEEMIVNAQPTSWWRFDEAPGSPTFADAMGRHEGSFVGSVTLGVPGAIAGNTNTGVHFARANSAYGSIPQSSLLNATTFTIEFWAYTTNAVDELGALSSYVNAPTQKGWSLRRTGGNTWRPVLAQADGVYGLVPERPAYVGRWNHFVLAVSPGGIVSYINGVWEGTWDGSGWIWNNEGPFRIGVDMPGAQGFNNYWDGVIDEVAYYPTVLHTETVMAHYQAGRYGTSTPPTFLTQPRSQTVAEGASVTFNPEVEGTQPISFAWWKNNNPIPDATNLVLVLNNVTFAEAGSYVLRATNSAGNAQSLNAVLTVAGQPTYANATNGLVMHLTFDSNLTDTTGRGNNGTASAPSGIVTSPAFTSGKIGSGSLKVASVVTADTNTFVTNLTSTSYVTLGVRPDLQFGSVTNFSVAYWIKYTNVIGDLPIFGNSESSLSSWGYTFAPNFTGGIGWSLNDDQSDRRFESDQAVNDGQWHHVAVSVERNGEIATYIDGAEVNRQLGYPGNLDNFQQCVIGQANTLNYQGFAAIEHGTFTASFEVDDLGVWRRALTPFEAYTIWYVGQTYARSFDTFGPVLLVLRPTGSNFELIWQSGTLEQADNLEGAWTNVPGAVAPYHVVSPTAARKFYRVRL